MWIKSHESLEIVQFQAFEKFEDTARTAIVYFMTQNKLRDWIDLATLEGKGADPANLTRTTAEGIEVKALYTVDDLTGLDHIDGLPGLAPFGRGPRATMYAGRAWTIRQYAGFSTAEKTNAFFRKALEGGQKGLSVAFDLPTHRGLDSKRVLPSTPLKI